MTKISNTKLHKALFLIMLYFALLFLLSGCGGSKDAVTSSSSSSSSSTTPVIATPASIKLSASPISVKSDDSSTATITATVLDSSNAAIQGLTVTFSATGGKLSAASAVSDASGRAQVTFSSGTVDQTNRVVMITGVGGSLTSQIPVTISGSTLELSTDHSNLIAGSDSATLTVTAKDASGTPVYNYPITLSTSVAGIVTLSRTSGNTDTQGKLTAIVTANGAGNVTVTVQGLGYTATQSYTVTPVGNTFRITSPATNPTSITTNTPLTVTVNAGSIANVNFATTLGTWDGGVASFITKPVVGGIVSAVISSNQAGMATIQVYDATNINITASIGVAFFAPVADATEITLQSDRSAVGLSIGGITKTAILSATVKNALHQPVGNAPVQFSVVNPTGGGETIYPVVAYTNNSGVATSIFTSGSASSSAQGVTLQAQVVSVPTVTNTKRIIIGGTAGSVVVGTGTVVSDKDPATYIHPMAVQVEDSNGNAVAGATVTLSSWPTAYSAGIWIHTDGTNVDCIPYFAQTTPNEDINENLILEPGEDVNFNGQLDPPSSSAGSPPDVVITDTFGGAAFNLEYLKNMAPWIITRVRASTRVLGTETTSSAEFRLSDSVPDVKACLLDDSPFTVQLLVGAAAGSTVNYRFPLFYTTSAVFSNTNQNARFDLVTTNSYTFTTPAGTVPGDIFYDTVSAFVTTSSGTTLNRREFNGLGIRIVAR